MAADRNLTELVICDLYSDDVYHNGKTIIMYEQDQLS